MSATGAQQALIGRPRLVRRPYREPRIKRADLRAQFIALTVPRAFDGVCTPIRQAVAPQAACQAAVIRGKRDSVPVVPGQPQGRSQMSDSVVTLALLAEQIANPEAHWSLGTFGAIAEFMRDADEPVGLSRSACALSAVTSRGGIHIEPTAEIRLVASETAVGEGWNHRLALCLRDDRCAMNRRSAITEIGRDAAALRPEDRDAVLFDLGLCCPQVDVCIRTSDPGLLGELRRQEGRGLLEPTNDIMGVILAAGPHRVLISRLGRIEVFQPIPAADGRSPMGPHTHVLPKLLAHRRTHAATEPIPSGFVPCAHLYPPHPAKDAAGHPRPFDDRHHETFQRMLETFGDSRLFALKRKVAAAIAAGEGPSAINVGNDRFARASVRVALRQLSALDRSAPKLAAWRAMYDGAARTEGDQQDAQPARIEPAQ